MSNVDDQLREYRLQQMRSCINTGVVVVPGQDVQHNNTRPPGAFGAPVIDPTSLKPKLIRQKEHVDQQIEQSRVRHRRFLQENGIQDWQPTANHDAPIPTKCQHSQRLYNPLTKSAACKECGNRVSYDIDNGPNVLKDAPRKPGARISTLHSTSSNNKQSAGMGIDAPPSNRQNPSSMNYNNRAPTTYKHQSSSYINSRGEVRNRTPSMDVAGRSANLNTRSQYHSATNARVVTFPSGR